MIYTFLLIKGPKHLLYQSLLPNESDLIILPHFKDEGTEA